MNHIQAREYSKKRYRIFEALKRMDSINKKGMIVEIAMTKQGLILMFIFVAFWTALTIWLT